MPTKPTPRSQRGMVTAELALASLAAVALGALLVFGVQLAILLMRCQDTAAEVARQQARGDRTAAQRAAADRPEGSRVSVDRASDKVRVTVDLAARPWGSWLPAVPLRSSAVVLVER